MNPPPPFVEEETDYNESLFRDLLDPVVSIIPIIMIVGCTSMLLFWVMGRF